MKPRGHATREQWVEAAFRRLEEGTSPADVYVSELREELGVTKGSFYHHFEDGTAELRAAVADRWARENSDEALGAMISAAHDPWEGLRVLNAGRRRTTRRDSAMRRWAASDEVAAAAVRQADATISEYVRQALAQAGFDETDAAAVAGVLVGKAGHDDFDTLLAVFHRAAPAQAATARPWDIDHALEGARDGLIMFISERELSPAAQDELRGQVREFVRQQRSGLAAEPGEGSPPQATEGAGA